MGTPIMNTGFLCQYSSLSVELSGPNIFVIGRMDGGNVWGRVTKQRGVVVVVGSGESRSVRSTASVVA